MNAPANVTTMVTFTVAIHFNPSFGAVYRESVFSRCRFLTCLFFNRSKCCEEKSDLACERLVFLPQLIRLFATVQIRRVVISPVNRRKTRSEYHFP